MEDNGIVKEDNVGPIQRYYYEDMMCRRDKEVEKWHKAWKTTFIALIVAVCIIIGGIIGFMYYEKQFTTEEWVFEASTEDGGNAIANGNGEVYYYGESKSNPPQENP